MTKQREQGFSLVELLVVLLIIIILLAVSIYSTQSAKNSGARIQAVATARAYEQAIDRFAATHGGMVPAASTDWPAATAAEGPIANINGEKKRYLKSIPETVQDGHISIVVGASTTSGSGANTTVSYVPVGTAGYRLELTSPRFEACAIYGRGALPGSDGPKEC